MLKQIEEYKKYVQINGFSKTRIDNAKIFLDAIYRELSGDVAIQLFNADFVATWQHLYYAALNALVAFRNQYAISKSLAVETVLYASAQRQIKKALSLVGVNIDTANVAVLLIGGDVDSVKNGFLTLEKHIDAKRDDMVLELTEAKSKRLQNAFDVSDAELESVSSFCGSKQALVDLIVERVALLSTRL